MQGPKAADFEKARVRVVEYVNSNFEKGVRNHNDAREKGLLAPQYGGKAGSQRNHVKFKVPGIIAIRNANTKRS